MIARVKKYASSRINDGPFPDRYNSETGQMVAFENRPVVGGHFALVRHSISLTWGTYEMIYLVLFSLLSLMSRGGVPITAGVVATVVERVVAIPAARHQPFLQHCL